MQTALLRAGLFFALTFFAAGPAIQAADTSPPPRLTVELRDGSRVVGESVEKNFRFHSALLGDLKLAVKDLQTVDCITTNSANLTTTSGDTLTVAWVDSKLAVKTGFGGVGLPVVSVRKVSVATSDANAHPPGLVALWSGEGNGKDAVGANHAVLTDITFSEGKVGQAFSFNGVSSSIRIPASPALDIGAGDGLTITAWIKPSDVDGMHPLFQWTDSSALNCAICFNSSESGVLMGNIAETGRNHFVVSNQGTLARNIFQHIAITYDKASGIGIWYLNGVEVAQRQLGSQIVVDTKGDFVISRRNTHQGDWSSNRSYVGLMDELALYNRALSATEIQTLCTEENHDEPLALPTPSSGWFEGWMR